MGAALRAVPGPVASPPRRTPEAVLAFRARHTRVGLRAAKEVPDDGHEYISRLRAITVKHMGDLWAAQMTRRREADDSEVMEDLKLQWNDVRKFTPSMPTWTAVSKTHVFRIRNLLLKWRRKATATDARQSKITQWLSTTARDPDSARGAANRLTTQQT